MTNKNETLPELTLGKAVEYQNQYNPELLQGVPRDINRAPLFGNEPMPFYGEDIWNGYEFSWLNERGKPIIAILQCKVPCESINLIESKSFKLYLNSFHQTKFDSKEEVLELLKRDLSACAQIEVTVRLFAANSATEQRIKELPGSCIDDLDIDIYEYTPNSSLLSTSPSVVEETLHSHLLKSNCLITNQPDWGSIVIRYRGNCIDKASLLKYIISFREHNEFHEQCVERVFHDINQICKPEQLTVMARYTRRGGLDINPFRSNFESPYNNLRTTRQ